MEMNIKELFDVGVSFESAVGVGTKEERARVVKNTSRINLPNDLVEEVKNFDKEINFLVSGEIFCPDFQLNVSVVKRLCDLNQNFNMSVISITRGKKFLAPILKIENYRAPTIVVLDKDMNVLGVFEETPKVVSAIGNFEEIKLNYFKGEYLIDTAKEIIDYIKKCN